MTFTVTTDTRFGQLRRLDRKTADGVRATGLANLGPKQIARECLKAAGLRNTDRMGDDQIYEMAMATKGTVAVADSFNPKVLLAVGATKDMTPRHKAGDLVREVASVVGGGGGGRPDFAQAGGRDASKIDAAIEKFRELIAAA